MEQKISQDDINGIVWKACDTFRGLIDPSQYKDYILTILFLKYVSDIDKWKRRKYVERYAGNAVRVERAMPANSWQACAAKRKG